ncbi:MAG: YqaJ-like viral recombinase [Novosphingobium sp. 28-62-57]|uniref:lambda exonuclease family protein n=1 Tax=Novosphingobium sp. 28-62-57 TaxID=1970409 RepID=UPI000BC3E8E7|nr:lambda exonuclease family protein [Novosphingobium sp. 28-62-57]OYZ07676.1 MAG: YqaJ-like viral recombinase [Novosphingobium sp. 28-62-57]
MTDNPFDLDYRESAAELDDFAEVLAADAPTTTGPTYHGDLLQGSDEWLQARCGLLTASEMKLIITATGKVANNDKTRTHAYELAFQRITGFVEPQYVSDAMLRGQEDEIYARAAYSEHYADVTETGFITNDKWGFTIGYSPDGLVGDDGLIECKSRAGKYQVQTIATDEVPEEYWLQLQTALLVSEREWVDFISYSGGQPVYVKRVYADPALQAAIIAAATAFEARIADVIREYHATLARMPKLIPTERREIEEIII